MDVRSMRYPSDFFDLIIDKSTIDAILCGDRSFMNTALMMKECQRVLKVDGSYMGISYGSPENRVLHYKRPHLKMTVQTFQVSPMRETTSSKEGLHYVYVCTKLEGANE
jgi:ubiquinone/menaquinone biosynthesis C-methylase UbiE